MSDKDGGISIATVIVLPRNARYCKYIINEGVTHSMKYYEMEKMLTELVPSQSNQIRELLGTFQNFMVIVPSQEVHVFRFDFEGERKKLSTELKQKLATQIPQINRPNSSLSEKVSGIIDMGVHLFDRDNYQK